MYVLPQVTLSNGYTTDFQELLAFWNDGLAALADPSHEGFLWEMYVQSGETITGIMHNCGMVECISIDDGHAEGPFCCSWPNQLLSLSYYNKFAEEWYCVYSKQ